MSDISKPRTPIRIHREKSCDEPTLQLGYTDPMVREDLFAIAKKTSS